MDGTTEVRRPARLGNSVENSGEIRGMQGCSSAVFSGHFSLQIALSENGMTFLG